VSSSETPDPHLIGLTLLARRELCTEQLRQRLRRRAVPDDAIESALHRLREAGALDDRRTATAYARQSVSIKHRGRLRTLREIERLGVDRTTARAAVDEVFEDVDERALIERALRRRLEGGITDRAHFRRLYQYLLRQGFDSDLAVAVLTERTGTS
jgi:regulatory protein